MGQELSALQGPPNEGQEPGKRPHEDGPEDERPTKLSRCADNDSTAAARIAKLRRYLTFKLAKLAELFGECFAEAAGAGVVDACIPVPWNKPAYESAQDEVVSAFANHQQDMISQLASAQIQLAYLESLPGDEAVSDDLINALLLSVGDDQMTQAVLEEVLPHVMTLFDENVAIMRERELNGAQTEAELEPAGDGDAAGDEAGPSCAEQDEEPEPEPVDAVAFAWVNDKPAYQLMWSDDSLTWEEYSCTSPPEWFYELVVHYWLDRKSMPPHTLDDDPEDDGLAMFRDLSA